MNKVVSAFLVWIGRTFLADQVTFLRKRVEAAVKNNRKCLHQDIAESLIRLLVVAEDRRFWKHYGVDVLAIVRALFHMALYRELQGASTIDQQLVRTLTGYRKLSLRRKVREMVLACVIGTFMPKREIATMYLCCAYYGWRMNSLNQACRRLRFDAKTLTLSESANLVARLKYPEPKMATAARRSLIERRAANIVRNAIRLTI